MPFSDPLPPALQTIEVDLRGLVDFADRLGDELRANLRPYADRVIAGHRQGVPFGHRTASAEVQSAAWEYHDCLSTAIEALDSYVTGSEALIRAADRISTSYRAADLAAAHRVEGVRP